MKIIIRSRKMCRTTCDSSSFGASGSVFEGSETQIGASVGDGVSHR